MGVQNKLETQYVLKLESAHNEVGDLKQQLELKAQENKSVHNIVDSLRDTNAELEVCPSLPSLVSHQS